MVRVRDHFKLQFKKKNHTYENIQDITKFQNEDIHFKISTYQNTLKLDKKPEKNNNGYL